MWIYRTAISNSKEKEEMLSLRNLHRSSEHKSDKKGLTINNIAHVYSLDGFRRLSNAMDQKNFLLQMETMDKFLMKRLGNNFIALKTCKLPLLIPLFWFFVRLLGCGSIKINFYKGVEYSQDFSLMQLHGVFCLL